jgi:hypothetical protein
MRKYQLRFVLNVTVAVVSLLQVMGCREDPPPSLFENFSNAPTPVIASIAPLPSALAGVTTVTITGTNFSSVLTNNIVYFDASPGTMMEASATQLKVIPPILVKDSVKVRIYTAGSDLFSDSKLYKLESATFKLDQIKSGQEPWAIAGDSTGAVFVSVSGKGIQLIPTGDTARAWNTSSFPQIWQSLKFGPDGRLYGCWNIQAIARIAAGSSITPIFFAGGTKIKDFAFDVQGNIWAAGNNTSIFRVTPTNNIKAFPLSASIRAVRVYGGYLYLAGTINRADTLDQVIRYPIISVDSLGPQEVYFNFSASALGGLNKYLYSMAFTSSGDLLLGTDRTKDPILIIRASTRNVEVFYANIFTPTPHILAWGRGTNLYVVRGIASAGAVTSSAEAIRVNAQVTGAP